MKASLIEGNYGKLDTFNKYFSLANNMFPEIFTDKSEFEVRIINGILTEYPENFFKPENLLNSQYTELSLFDFETYYSLLKTQERPLMLKNIFEKIVNPPIVLHGLNDVFWLLYGEKQMLTYRLLGISPIVKQINIEAEIDPKKIS